MLKGDAKTITLQIRKYLFTANSKYGTENSDLFEN